MLSGILAVGMGLRAQRGYTVPERLCFRAVTTPGNFWQRSSAVNLQPSQASKLCWKKKNPSKMRSSKHLASYSILLRHLSMHGGGEGVEKVKRKERISKAL